MFRTVHYLTPPLLMFTVFACSDGPAQPAENLSPRALLALPPCGVAGEAIELDASRSTDDDGRIFEYRFLFGDGTSEIRGVSPLARHTFDGPGTYEQVLTVKDDRGAIANTRAFIRILPRAACAADGDCAAGDLCVGALCRPGGDGGVCQQSQPTCPPASKACGTVNDPCDAMTTCVNGCCQPVKENP